MTVIRVIIVSTLCVTETCKYRIFNCKLMTYCGILIFYQAPKFRDAERLGRHSHAERGNDANVRSLWHYHAA